MSEHALSQQSNDCIEVRLQLLTKIDTVQRTNELALLSTATNHFDENVLFYKNVAFLRSDIRIYKKNELGKFEPEFRVKRTSAVYDDNGMLISLRGLPPPDNYVAENSMYTDFEKEMDKHFSHERRTFELNEKAKKEAKKVMDLIEGQPGDYFQFFSKNESISIFHNLNWLLERKGKYMIRFEMAPYTLKKDDIRVQNYLL